MKRKANPTAPVRGRRYPRNPIVGVGAIIFRRGAVLLAERGRQPLRGYWSLPGGALELGEPLREGIRREVREETGLEVRPLDIAEVFERIYHDDAGRTEYHYVLIDFRCRVTGGELRAGDDASGVEWVPVQRLGERKLTPGTQEVIERAYAKYKRRTARV